MGGIRSQFLPQIFELGSGLLQESLQGLAAVKRGRSGAGADTHAVLSDAVQIDQASLTQHLHGLFEQLLNDRGVIGTEIGERVVVDGDSPGEPAKGIVTETQIGELPSAGTSPRGWHTTTKRRAAADRWPAARPRGRGHGCGHTTG